MLHFPKLTPFLQPGRKTWAVTVVNAEGVRGNRSLETQDRQEAEKICEDLGKLIKGNQDPFEESKKLIRDRAYQIYFGVPKPAGFECVDKVLDPFKLQEQVETLKKEVEELRGYKLKYEALAHSVEGKRAAALDSSPTFAQVDAAYLKDMEACARKGAEARYHYIKFKNSMGLKTRLVDVSPGKINDWLDEQAKNETHRHRLFISIGRFFAWVERLHSIPSPMKQVTRRRVKAQRDIHWHALEEIESVLAGLDGYWAAVIATMAFAGLSAHEVRGLRHGDLIDTKTGTAIRVQPNEERGLKTSNRKRNVIISDQLAKYLQPHLAAHPGKPDDVLFTSPLGAPWTFHLFSKHVNQRTPETMDCLSLRRTFGSLLIRAGRTTDEVAAAMGNTPDMVRKHYARILGGEVNTNL